MALQALATVGGASLDASASNRLCQGTQRRSSRWRVTAKFGLPPLPYKTDALEPYMSRRTLEAHWGRHQRGFIETLNEKIEDTPLEGYLLEDIVRKTYNRGNPQPAFNSAAEAWNHDFFFNSMKPGGGKAPTGEIAELIDKHLGSFDNFLKEFKLAASTQFGGGWVWLALDDSDQDAKLVVRKTPNAINPLIWDQIPLIALDIWEHAYYLDFQEKRADYVDTFFEELVNWDMINARLDRARAFMNWGEPDWKIFNKNPDILDESYADIF